MTQRQIGGWLLAALAAVGAAACNRTSDSTSSEPPAVAEVPRTQHVTTREPSTDRKQAMASCTLACLQSVEKADGSKETKRAYCDDDCVCFVEARFDETGKAKAFTPQQVSAQVEACRAFAIDKAKWSPNLINGVPFRPVAVAASAVQPLDPNKSIESREELREACVLGCVDTIHAAVGTKEIKRAFCDGSCTCFAAARFDAAGKKLISSEQAVFEQIDACRAKTAEKLKWSPK